MRGFSALMILMFAACSTAGDDRRDTGAHSTDAGERVDAAVADARPTGADASISDTGTADGSLDPDATAEPADSGAGDASGTVSPELESFILEKMVEAAAPGLAAAIIKNGAVAWSAGFGLADIGENRPVTADSIFILASVSKPPIAVAAMQLVEQNLLDLDADVQTYIPFNFRNPNFPNTPITIRMLMTHTSSFNDSAEIDAHLVAGDSPIALGEFLEGYATPGGAYYRAENWSTDTPGTVAQYSNAGASMAAYVVEAVAARDYADYARANIFQPLGMTHTHYRLVGLDPALLATPYGGTATTGYTSYGQYGYPDYPDGALRSSANDLARFLLMFSGGGALGPTRVLAEASVMEISRRQIPAIESGQALIWYHIFYEGRMMLGHSGAYLGCSTDMYFDPSDGVGFVVLTNGDTYLAGIGEQIDALDQIERRLLREAAGL